MALFGTPYACQNLPVDDVASPVGGPPNFGNPIDDNAKGEVFGDIQSVLTGDKFHFAKILVENASGEDVTLDTLFTSGFIEFNPGDNGGVTIPCTFRIEQTNASVVGQNAFIHYEDAGGNVVTEILVLTDSAPWPVTSGSGVKVLRVDLPIPAEPSPTSMSVWNNDDNEFLGLGLEVIYGEVYISDPVEVGTFPEQPDDNILDRLDSGNYFGGGAYDQQPPQFGNLFWYVPGLANLSVQILDFDYVAFWLYQRVPAGMPALPRPSYQAPSMDFTGLGDFSSDPFSAFAVFSWEMTEDVDFSGRCVSKFETAWKISGRCVSKVETSSLIRGKCRSLVKTDNSIVGRCLSSFQATNQIAGRCISLVNTILPPLTPGGGPSTVPYELTKHLKVELRDPGIGLKVISVTVTEEIDRGFTAVVNYEGFFDVTTLSLEDEFILTLFDDIAQSSITYPPMVILSQQEATLSQCPKTSIRLMDKYTANLAKTKVNLDTLLAVNSITVANLLASAAGVVTTGLDSWTFIQEDLKDTKALDGLKRIGRTCGKDTSIALNGTFRFLDPVVFEDPAPISFRPTSVSPGIDHTKKKGQQDIVKTSPINQGDQTFSFDTTGQHPVTLERPVSPFSPIVDESPDGFADLIGFWNGDPNQGGTLLRFRNFNFREGNGINVPISPGAGQATHLTVGAFNSVFSGPAEPCDVQIRIIGAPAIPPEGTEFEFNTSIGSGQPSEVLDEPGFPTEAFVLAREARLRALFQKGFKTITAVGPADLGLRVGQLFKQPANPFTEARIESVSHTISVAGSGVSTTTIKCNIPEA